jgi:hypothetical protein
MHDYLSKPLRPYALESMLLRHVRESSEAPGSNEIRASGAAECPELEAAMASSSKLVQRRDSGLARRRAEAAREHFKVAASRLLEEQPSLAPTRRMASGAPPA